MPERQRLLAAYLSRFRNKSYAGRQAMNNVPEREYKPHTLLVSCFESNPLAQCLFCLKPGEVLHHNEIAALVPPHESHRTFGPYSLLSKLEYAIEVAGVEHMVVLGNTHSRGMDYLLNGTRHHAIADWMDVALNSLERARKKLGNTSAEELHRETLRQSVLQSVRNLLTYPVVYKSVKRGQITLNAWYYEGSEKMLYAYNADTGKYEPVQNSADNHNSKGKTEQDIFGNLHARASAVY